MDELFIGMIETLRAARQAVRDEIERYAKSSGEEADRLTRALQAERGFSGQAESLLNMMIERDPLNAEIALVEDLLEFFYAAEQQVVDLIEAGRG